MAGEVEKFVSVEAQWARVKPGFAAGDMFNNPIEHPAMQFVDGIDPARAQTLEAVPTPKVSPTDPWVDRKSNSAY